MLYADGKKVQRSKSRDYDIHGRKKKRHHGKFYFKKSVCALQNERINTKFPKGSILQVLVKTK
jgi:hypothetical protein